MIPLPRALEILNGVNYSTLPFLLKWQDIYFRTSIHTTGTCPCFIPIRDDGKWSANNDKIYPVGWLHERYDWIFDTHLINRHPRESEITRNWRKSVYRPYQQAPLLQVIDKIKATIFAENKYTLTVEDTADNEYIWGDNFEGKNLVEYVNWHFKTICEDPNSFFAVIPKVSGVETNTQKVEPVIKHIPTKNIVYLGDDEIIFWEDDTYAWYINSIGYFKYQKIDGVVYPMYDAYGYYAHMLGYKPVFFAGGIWNSHKFYDSYLKSAQAFCDDFVASHSAVQMINKEASHPIIAATSKDCPTCNGVQKVQFCTSCNRPDTQCRCETHDAWGLITCNTCNGSGVQSHNPADWFIIPPEQMDKDIVKISNFDVSVNDYLAKFAEKLYEGIRKSLHQQFIDEAQSGKAKEIDRTGEMLFYNTVSNGVWGLIEQLLKAILAIRNTSTENGNVVPNIPNYILVKPTDFDLKTEWDLLNEYREATESKMPDWVRTKQVLQYFDKVYGGDDVMVKKATTISQMDAYAVTTIPDKISILTSGAMTNRDFQFSSMLNNMLDEVIRTKGNKWFIDAPYDEIKGEVDKIFAKVPEVKPTNVIDKTIVNA